MSSAALFVSLSQDERIERIEVIRRHIHEVMAKKGEDSGPDLPLSETGTAWLVRMRRALVDEASRDSFPSLRRAFIAYLNTLELDDGTELYRRVWEFGELQRMILEDDE